MPGNGLGDWAVAPSGVEWCHGVTDVRRSVTLPSRLAEQVERIAKKRRLSDNRVLVELVEQGLEAHKEKEKAFFALAERFQASAIQMKLSTMRWDALSSSVWREGVGSGAADRASVRTLRSGTSSDT